ncbi:MAG TPA: T9SS type A sorting domain-containing protein, partial [Parafilimonas sp.]|nr:T9SS type A sorting domain-containing protein [Parafilimonas sp.]
KGNLQTTNLNLTKNGGTGVSVWSLFATATKLYAGGDFDQAGSDLRSDFVEADISSGSGNVQATDASPDDIVYAINVQGNNIVYGGNFGFSNLAKRNYLGLVKMSTGKILPFAPSPDSYVFDMAVNYNRIFIVGQFDNVNGTPHTGAAAFNKSTGALLTWNPQLARSGQSYYADLYSIAADSNTVYLGGAFDRVAGTVRNNAAAVAATNASLLAWDPEANNAGINGWVRAIAMNGANLLIGGDFNFCKGAPRRYAAKIDSATGLVNTSWDPSPNGYIYAINSSGTNIYLGGNYSQLAGVTRTSLGSVSASNGAVTNFDPVIQGTVNALAFDASGILYVGGSFSNAKATARNNVAAFATSGSGTLQAWDPNAGSTVWALAAIGTKIFIGGSFTTLNGGAASRHYFGSVNNTNGTATTFDPYMNGAVLCLSNSGNNLYVGGQFSTVANGGSSRFYQALYDASTGALKTWNPAANSYVYGIAVQTDTVYSTGYYTTLNGNPRGYAGAVRGSAGTATLSVNPNMGNIGRSTWVSEHMWLIGGQFQTAGGDVRTGFAVYDLPGNAPLQSGNTATEEYVRTANSLQNQFALYPNPAHGIVTVKLNNAVSGKLNITVTDMNGKKVLQQSAEGNYLNYIKVNTSALKNGTYVITLTGEDINFNSIVVIAN